VGTARVFVLGNKYHNNNNIIQCHNNIIIIIVIIIIIIIIRDTKDKVSYPRLRGINGGVELNWG